TKATQSFTNEPSAAEIPDPMLARAAQFCTTLPRPTLMPTGEPMPAVFASATQSFTTQLVPATMPPPPCPRDVQPTMRPPLPRVIPGDNAPLLATRRSRTWLFTALAAATPAPAQREILPLRMQMLVLAPTTMP